MEAHSESKKLCWLLAGYKWRPQSSLSFAWLGSFLRRKEKWIHIDEVLCNVGIVSAFLTAVYRAHKLFYSRLMSQFKSSNSQ